MKVIEGLKAHRGLRALGHFREQIERVQMSIREAHRGLNALGELSTGFEATYCYS
jgi:hypothetical protein